MADDPEFPEGVRFSSPFIWALLGIVASGSFYFAILTTKIDRALEWEAARDKANGPAEFVAYKAKTDRLESELAAMKAQLSDLDKKMDHTAEIVGGTNKMLEQAILNYQFSHPPGDHDGAPRPSR